MILKALEMGVVWGHGALGSLPRAKLLNIMVMPPSISDENFRGKYWTDLSLKSCMLVFFSWGYEICKALKEQKLFILSIVCLQPSFSAHSGLVKRLLASFVLSSLEEGHFSQLAAFCSLHVFLCVICKYAFPIRGSYVHVQRFIL